MKFSFFPLMILLFSACSSQSIFKLMDATSQRWSAGIKGSGTGITYEFKVKLTSEEQIEFGRVWVANRSVPVNVKRIKLDEVNSEVQKGDVLILEYRFVDNAENIVIEDPPIEHQGEALIEYFVNGGKKYKVIENIRKLEQSVSY